MPPVPTPYISVRTHTNSVEGVWYASNLSSSQACVESEEGGADPGNKMDASQNRALCINLDTMAQMPGRCEKKGPPTLARPGGGHPEGAVMPLPPFLSFFRTRMNRSGAVSRASGDGERLETTVLIYVSAPPSANCAADAVAAVTVAPVAPAAGPPWSNVLPKKSAIFLTQFYIEIHKFLIIYVSLVHIQISYNILLHL